MSTVEWDEDLVDVTPDADDAPSVPQLYYPALPAFVENFLAPTYRRSLSAHTMTWCAEWWQHPEAMIRLDALWRAWEHLRLEPALGISVWLRDHADHHMRVLLSTEGPFHGCTPDRHTPRPLPALPTEPAPPALFESYAGS